MIVKHLCADNRSDFRFQIAH